MENMSFYDRYQIVKDPNEDWYLRLSLSAKGSRAEQFAMMLIIWGEEEQKDKVYSLAVIAHKDNTVINESYKIGDIKLEDYQNNIKVLGLLLYNINGGSDEYLKHIGELTTKSEDIDYLRYIFMHELKNNKEKIEAIVNANGEKVYYSKQ